MATTEVPFHPMLYDLFAMSELPVQSGYTSPKKKRLFYMPIFLWDIESSPNYTEKLIFAGIGTIALRKVLLAITWNIVRNQLLSGMTIF
jgi:hypothetical protein